MYNKVFMYAYARMGPPQGGAALYIKAAARAPQLCARLRRSCAAKRKVEVVL